MQCDELETITTTTLDEVTGGCAACGNPSHGRGTTSSGASGSTTRQKPQGDEGSSGTGGSLIGR